MKNKKKYILNSIYGKKFNFSDLILKTILYFSFLFVIGIFLFFIIHIIKNGIKVFNFSLIYKIEDGVQKGILPTIINTFYVVILTLLITTPIGIGCAIYLTQYAKHKKLIKFVSFSTNILASIPSILLGLFGYTVFCIGFNLGVCILAGCLTLSICILPNIIETSKESLIAVPNSYKNGALSLGASKFRVIKDLILPCAMPGILTSTILSAGRIIGESAALLLTIGTSSKMPSNFLTHFLKSGKTLTLHLYFTAGNATSKDSINICYAIAIILIILIFILNCMAKLIANFLKK